MVVSDSLITPTGGTTPCALVAPGGTCTLIGTYVVSQADVDAGQIDNIGTADSDQTGPVDDPETVPVPQGADLGVDKALTGNADEDGSGTVSLNDTLTYTITATNIGNVTLNNVTVSDDLTGDSTACATVAPGDTCVLVVTYTVSQADVDAGVINNIGTADSDETPPVDDPETVPVPQGADLGVDKVLTGNADEDGSGSVSLNDTLTYTITATNIGNVTLNNVTVSDDLTGDSTACPTVAPGDTCVLVVTYTVSQADVDAGVINNIGTADSDETPPVDDPETVPVPQGADLGVDKVLTGNADEDGSGSVSLNDTLTYTITATNIGNVTLNNVTVSDDLTGDSTACATVAPGDTCVLVVTYTVSQADVDAGVINNIGTADSDETPPVDDPETVPVPQGADLGVDKVLTGNADEDGSGSVSLNDTLTYTITATNIGNVTLNNVTVSDDLTGDSTACPTVAPGDTCVLVVTYTVSQADVDAGVINNIGTADSDETPPVDDPETVPVPQGADLGVDKALTGNADEDGSGTVSLNDTLTYTITATNIGNVTLNNVTVSDDLTGDSTACPTVAPGDTCVLVVTYTVSQADVDAGVINNIGTADSDETPPVDDPETVPVPQGADLGVDKVLTGNADEDGSGSVSLNDTLTYTITATNIGNVTLNNVTVSDDLTGDSTACPTVAPGDTCVLVVTYTVSQADVDAGVINNIGTADSDETPPVDDPETVPVPQGADLGVDKVLTGNADEDGSGSVSLNDTLTYTITATNIGNVTLNNVTVSDDLTGDSTACPTVAPGDTCVLVVTYTVSQADVDAGVINNIGTADSDETPPVDDPETVPVPQGADLGVDKVLTGNADEDGSGTVSLNDTLTYTITATNIGNVTLNNVTVSDDLTGDSTACPTVAPGDTCVLVVTYTVSQADVDAGVINNIGTADSDETPPVDDPETVPVPQGADLGVDKALTGNADEDGSGTVSLNDTLTYTITATNIGNVTLNNVTVSDNLTGDSTACATVAPGDTCVLVVTYTVSQADVDAGVINNIGTADSDETPPVDDPETVPVPQGADLGVDKVLTGNADEDGSGTVSLNDTLTYTITATNIGNVTLNNVTVSDNLTGDSTACATVAPGDTCVLVVTYTVSQADVDAGVINNIGTADSDETPPVDDPETVPVPQGADLGVDKVLTGNADEDGSGTVSLNDTLTYTITATNIGNVTLNNVTVSDDLTGDSTACPTVAPGDTCVLVVTYTVSQADVDAGVINNIGTADSDETPPVDDPETVPVPQGADLGVDKVLTGNADEDGSGTVSLNDTLTYTITATNIGNVTLNNVTVSDDLTGDSTACPTVAPGDTCVLVVTYTVSQADVDAGVINNIGTADSDETPPVDDPETVPVPQGADLGVDKALTGNADEDGSGTVSLNDTLTYTITATNIGNVTLNNVTVSDDLTGDSTACATVAPGDTCVLVVTYTVSQADVDAGVINNIGTADSDETPPVDDPETVPVPQGADLGVDKVLTGNADEDGSGSVSLNDTLTYTITATNIGNVTLNNVTVSDDLTGDSTACPTVAPGDTCVLVVTYTVSQADVDAGVINNIGTADSDETPPVDDPETVPVPQGADLGVDKVLTGNADEDGSGSVSLNDTLTYTITATNIGNVTLNNVTVSDDLTGDSTACPTVAPGDTCVLVVTYTVSQADVDAGVINNIGTADSDETPPVDDPETVPVPQGADLGVDKVLTGNADEDGSGSVSLNDTLTYTITATNIGNVTLNNVTVSDDLTGDSTACPTVAPGDTCVLVVTYTVSQADVDAGVINNIGTADSDETPPVDDPETVPVPQGADLGVDKVLTGNADEDGSGTVSLNDTLTYTITATNIGNVTLNNVTVSDDLTGDSTACPTVAPGDTCVLVVTYTVSQADVDAGVINNIGTADSDETPPVDDPETVPVPQGADLGVDKALTGNADEDGSGTVSLNDTLTYTITATNIGNVTLNNVTVSDNLTGDSTACATVAPGDTCVLVVTYTVSQADVDAGVINNIGTADSDETPPVDDPETVPVPQGADLGVDKVLTGNADEDGSGTVSLNDTLTYTITATNIRNVRR